MSSAPRPLRSSPNESPPTCLGSIQFIRLQDFMSYHDVSVRPGPGFNVVIGPNGSGKSSIVSAITLGLGGDLSELKRQRSITDFVNTTTDADCARITIELYRDHERVYKVQCEIKRSGQIVFHLDEVLVTQAKVKNLVEKLSIQTNNLCQFLPQDVVRDFPDMPSHEKLFNTIRAVGDGRTNELLQELKDEQDKLESLQQMLQIKVGTFTELERKWESSTVVRNVIRQRQRLQNSLNLLGIKEKFFLFKQLRLDIRDLEKKIIDSKEKIDSLAHSKAELDQKLETHHQAKTNLELTMVEPKDVIANYKAFMSSSPSEILNDKIKSITNNLNSLTSRYESKAQQIEQLEEEIQSATQQIDSSKTQGKLESEYETLNKQLKAKQCEITAKEHLHSVALAELNALDRQIQRLSSERSRLHSEENQKMNILKQRNPDVFQGLEWLRANRDRFNHTIHDPIMVCLRVLGPPENALYLERLIGAQDLQAFVCEDPSDANKLMNILRSEKKLSRINVITSSNTSTSNCEPIPCSIQGFKGFVSDMMDCPPAVRTYLCSKKQLNRIPVFTAGSDSKHVGQKYFRYFVDRKLFVKRQGRYSNSESVSIENCANDEVRFFPSATVDDNELQSNERNIAWARKEQTKKKWEAESLTNELKAVNSAHDRISNHMADKKHEIERLKGLQWKIKDLEGQVDVLKKSADIQSLRERSLNEREKALKQISVVHQEMLAFTNKYSMAVLTLKFAGIQMEQLEKSSSQERTAHADIEADHNAMTTMLKDLETKKVTNTQAFQKIHREVQAHITFDKKRVRLKPEFEKSLQEVCPGEFTSHSEARARMETLEKDLRDLPAISQRDEDDAKLSERKFKEAKDAIQDMKAQISRHEKDAIVRGQTISRRIQELVSKIDSRFSAMMADLGHAGCIKLDQGEGPSDFKSFGLDIMVNFAGAKGNMEALSGSVQSGGEKSVSTAVFMMALQELTQVPFRCVDEINQGMDEVNERLIWKMLLTTANRYTAQYMYFSPKFPRELEFTPDIKAVFCINGALRVDLPNHFHLSNILQRMKKKRKIVT
ncbi:hypothetical protein TCAL_00493 [Tigriopus californicus]|uniref:Structural maintenance of chromosomes protein 5 n=1 Tax=Tigriopus californicus TaxID=6832 RepID=A0A553NFR2_TIGCA|nr:structural maintenance of chromosomes protein 5-like [Tigriopus californicus]TRY64209.1 hypothetical protein TCAL_00493 [Tigriopus californicus]|eukprot:TCALIF_00493-PA protein Name:"Similar to Smc5 Structural maintenance of chromosomes protein 5 (Mus musculus)" AED:0.01 eAED:0.01 QI:265/1/1/1/1/1/4/158/1058